MKSQRRAEGMAAVAAQPMSAHALLRGIAEERLTNEARSASMATMKTRPNSDGALAGAVQPALSAVLLRGTAGEMSASDVRWAEVSGMNRRDASCNC